MMVPIDEKKFNKVFLIVFNIESLLVQALMKEIQQVSLERNELDYRGVSIAVAIFGTVEIQRLFKSKTFPIVDEYLEIPALELSFTFFRGPEKAMEADLLGCFSAKRKHNF